MLLLGLAGNMQTAKASDLNQFIVGGQAVTSQAKYPFMASIYFDVRGDGAFRPVCGGTLIAQRWLLTAAHCLYNKDFGRTVAVERVGVLLGQTDLSSEDGSFIRARNLIVHPGYDKSTSKNDIALIELENQYAAPLAVLPSANSTVPVLGELGVVLGWGAIVEGGGLSNRLREVSLPIISNASCFPYYSKRFDSRLALCAGGNRSGGQDACQGDSGGPILVTRENTYVLAGIVSYGDGCARRGVPGVYTRVQAYADWITSFTSGSLIYSGNQDTPVVDETTITRLNLNEAVTGQLQSGQVAYFEVTGARQVNLTSNSGDADMFIIDDANFQAISAELVRCFSQETGELDICIIEEQASSAYAVVYGYTDATYTISAQLASNSVNTTQALGTGAQSDVSSRGGSGRISFALLFLLSCIRWSRFTRLFG